jgi:rhodanese-related sulfurtransferase
MQPETVKKLRFVTIEDVLEMKANAVPFKLVDTLPSESYKEGHIPGAINIPSDGIATEAEDSLDKDYTIVTYCAGYTCEASTVAAKKLIDLGYGRVLDFKGGKKAWKDAGFELGK